MLLYLQIFIHLFLQVERVHVIFDCILSYAKELLTYEDGFAIPKDLEIRESDCELTSNSNLYDIRDTYVTMLYNDETHTYDQVSMSD